MNKIKDVENYNLWIINYMHRLKHPEAYFFDMKEAHVLVEALYKRLKIQPENQKIDFQTLGIIEKKVIEIYKDLYKIPELEKMRLEITRITRELIAYFGLLIVDTTDWVWADFPPETSLEGTSVIFQGPKSKRVAIGNWVSVFFDNMYHYSDKYEDLLGEYLLRDYQKIAKKRFPNSL